MGSNLNPCIRCCVRDLGYISFSLLCPCARGCNCLAAGGRWLRIFFRAVLEPKLRAGMHFETFCAPLLWEVVLVPGDLLRKMGWSRDWSNFLFSTLLLRAFFLPVGLKNEQRNLSVRDHKENVYVLFNWMGDESHLEMSLEKSSSQDASDGILSYREERLPKCY